MISYNVRRLHDTDQSTPVYRFMVIGKTVDVCSYPVEYVHLKALVTSWAVRFVHEWLVTPPIQRYASQPVGGSLSYTVYTHGRGSGRIWKLPPVSSPCGRGGARQLRSLRRARAMHDRRSIHYPPPHTHTPPGGGQSHLASMLPVCRYVV